MKLLALSICLIATTLVVQVTTFTNEMVTIEEIVTNNANLTDFQLQNCYIEANLKKDELFTDWDLDLYKELQNLNRKSKNGCFVLCVARERGLVVNDEIFLEKLYKEEAHNHLSLEIQTSIKNAIGHCAEQVKRLPCLCHSYMCEAALSTLACLWKSNARMILEAM